MSAQNLNNFRGLYDIRDFKESDRAFVMATSLRGLFYGKGPWSLIPKHIFMANYKVFLNAVINSPKNVVKIACLPDDQDVIIGYSILSADYQTVHFIFVKTPWRLKGVGRSLLPQSLLYASHLTEVGQNLIHKVPGLVFNPFSIGY